MFLTVAALIGPENTYVSVGIVLVFCIMYFLARYGSSPAISSGANKIGIYFFETIWNKLLEGSAILLTAFFLTLFWGGENEHKILLAVFYLVFSLLFFYLHKSSTTILDDLKEKNKVKTVD